ncbi:hypothetical protein SLW56_06940 [Xanthomonas sp. LF07-6]|uniref:hypothetical protein n=1 Tax=Xanthomonas sp. LF07-6 TaxID=3097550 RepID=UPI002A826D44|nr:hypothetical protein [Xanthomonas sp. LF07-6]MDY4339510.1 hypothetical protein [Xanthomonas sp. LF07-6]
MVFSPIALAMRIRCNQSAFAIRSGCSSPLRICHGCPSSVKRPWAKPNVCGRPSGTGADAGAAARSIGIAAKPNGASKPNRQNARRFNARSRMFGGA